MVTQELTSLRKKGGGRVFWNFDIFSTGHINREVSYQDAAVLHAQLDCKLIQ